MEPHVNPERHGKSESTQSTMQSRQPPKWAIAKALQELSGMSAQRKLPIHLVLAGWSLHEAESYTGRCRERIAEDFKVIMERT